jgi:hypothetical protein
MKQEVDHTKNVNKKLLFPYSILILLPSLLFGYLAIISLLAPILEEYYL